MRGIELLDRVGRGRDCRKWGGNGICARRRSLTRRIVARGSIDLGITCPIPAARVVQHPKRRQVGGRIFIGVGTDGKGVPHPWVDGGIYSQ